MLYKIIIIILILNKNINSYFIKDIINPKKNYEIFTKKETFTKYEYNKIFNIKKNIKESNEFKYKIIINKINLNKNIYYKNNKMNNVDKNVTLIKDSDNIMSKNSIIILAAHSGNASNSFFNNINELEKGDIITLKSINKTYCFVINEIFEQNKTGYINIQKESKSELILTTCSNKNQKKQLIIKSILKES